MNCILCGGSATEPLARSTDRLYGTTSAEFDIVRCTACGMATLAKVPPDLASFYPPSYWFDPAENVSSRWAERYRRFVAADHVSCLYHAWQSSGGNALDVGCGGGLLYGLLRKMGVPAFGLDTSTTAAALAWRHNRLPALAGDLTSAPFGPESFGLISMFHVLEHLHDPRAFLNASRALLVPQGRIVVQVPNLASWQARIFRSRWNGLDVPRHLFNFRASDLRALLRSCGFEIVREKHFSLRDNPAGLATTIAPSLDPMARRIRDRRSTILHHAAYFGLVLASLPFALLEAAFGEGGSIIIEARKL